MGTKKWRVVHERMVFCLTVWCFSENPKGNQMNGNDSSPQMFNVLPSLPRNSCS